MSSGLTLGQIRESNPYKKASITRLFRFNDNFVHGAQFTSKDISFLPENANVSDGGLLRFVIPRRGYLDFSELKLQLQLTMAGSSTYSAPILDFGSWNLIDRIRALWGSQQAEQLDYYGVLQNVIHANEGDVLNKGINTIGSQTNGCGFSCLAYNTMRQGSRWQVSSLSTSPAAPVVLNLLIPINLQSISSRILPMKHMPESLVIEIYLKKAIGCISVVQNSGAPPPPAGIPSYTISNARLRGDMVTVTQDYDAICSRAMESSAGISWRFTTWSNTSRNVQNSVETVQITDKLGCINNVTALHVPYLFNNTVLTYPNGPSENASATTSFVDQTWCWPDLGVSKYAYRIDGEMYPPDMVQVSTGTPSPWLETWHNSYAPNYHSDYFHHVMKQLNKTNAASIVKTGASWQPFWGMSTPCVPASLQSANNGGSTTFIMPQNFESFIGSDLVDGLNTTRAENVFQLVINYKAALPQPVPLLIIVEYEALVSFTKSAFALTK